MESGAYLGWVLSEAARAQQKREQDFPKKLRNWGQRESKVRREKNGAWRVGEFSCSLSRSSLLTQVLPHPLHPLPAQGSEDPGR